MEALALENIALTGLKDGIVANPGLRFSSPWATSTLRFQRIRLTYAPKINMLVRVLTTS